MIYYDETRFFKVHIINYNLTPSAQRLIILSKEIASPALLFIVNLGLKFAWTVTISVSESCGLDQSSVLLSAVKRSIGFTIRFHTEKAPTRAEWALTPRN